ncbi:hypothetical protein IGB42_03582 [Andreprevotia sp. IGB-42]|uniref:hypothetical protein n=1 Tax=Andreprevotia sp. IGB-42 TaxID=2497473 RepID=UPI001356863F|nr:hypothetical protein [Andreprevotia sp. IGB-42]KAF0812040.1 hypothetical protein IGB42_03582 [Andreprevotia sp. IGB-42]
MPIPLLSPVSPRDLALILSDLEAGTPRQWFWLEIAATQPASPPPSRLHPAAILLRRGGPALVWPWLRQQKLPGLALYTRSMAPLWQRLAQVAGDSALACTALPALLAGFDRLPAIQLFTVWLLMLGGMAWQGWRAIRTAPPVGRDDTDLPGPEDSVGITGQLLAAGATASEALALTAALRADASRVWPALQVRLPALAPGLPGRGLCGMLSMLAWLAASLPMLLALSWLPAPWGLPAGIILCAAVAAGGKGRLAGGFVLLAGLLAFALGRLGHVL